jgi:hypothetical protein
MAPILPLKEHHAPPRIEPAERGATGYNNCPDGIEQEDTGVTRGTSS